ncbi:class I SAM-dependent methyltransferase [Phaeacidiphilus oryzae]|uniref:class I SAM-dependent methyltransferase n=1 Tax=Phaeacidiphilus oryzae TaxID=348818 RepID=UPI00068EC961|nr:class I SAM-dependent methyltransferase [Phaeacidiphilus oryzae]
MPEQSRSAAAVWSEPGFAAAWAGADPAGEHDLLALPRRIAARLIAAELPAPRVVVDIAAGPGGFLEVLLDAFPGARGIWLDASAPMRELAGERLARFGDRVDFRLGDMVDPAAAGLAEGGADVVLSSRASHHLSGGELRAFYRGAAALLAPGGWFANLDHIGPVDAWDRRYRAVRRAMAPANRQAAPPHHHDYPLAGAAEHLDALRSAGVLDADIAWKAFFTCLFIGRAAPAQPAADPTRPHP